MDDAGIEVVPVSSLLETPALDTATTGDGSHAGS